VHVKALNFEFFVDLVVAEYLFSFDKTLPVGDCEVMCNSMMSPVLKVSSRFK